MPNASPLQAANNQGEFSPRMVARVDFARYRNAASILRNFLILPQGGVARRPGTRFVIEVKDSTVKHRLLDFQFSTEQAYQIIFGEQNLRFITAQAQIAVADTDAAITNGTFTGNITGWTDQSGGGSSIAHDATNDRLDLISNGTTDAHAEQSVTVGGGFQAVEHVLKFRIYGAPGDIVKLRIGTTSTGTEIVNDVEFPVGFHTKAFTPGASPFFVQFLHRVGKTLQVDDVSLIDNTPMELAAPWTEAQLFAIQKTQSADVMYVVHKLHPPYKLERRGNTTWSLVEVPWEDGPYLNENTTATTMTASAVTGLAITVTASALTGVNGGAGFTTSDLHRSIRIQHGTNDWGWAVIVGITSTTVVTVDIKRDFNATTATDKWKLGSWSVETGYPGTITFFQRRLVAANTSGEPQTFWMSQTAQFEFMRPDSFVGSAVTVEDDDALFYELAAEQVNAIQWIRTIQANIAIGTVGGEWIATSVGPAISPTDIDITRETTYGSAPTIPVLAGKALLFVQRARRKIREMLFNFDVDGYVARDLTILADHVTRSGLIELAWQQEPDSIMWAVRDDGVLATLTYRRAENVAGWARQILGGSFSTGDPVAESVSVIPGDDDAGQVYSSLGRDEVWIIVKRTINSVTRRYVEVLEGLFEGPIREDFETEAAYDAAILLVQEDAFYVDSGITYDSTPTTAITGLSHLEGETVKVLADGAVHPDLVVSSGAITLEQAASVVQAGLGFRHRYKSLKWNFGVAAGTAVAKTKRIKAAALVLLDSGAFEIGTELADMAQVTFREVGDPMDAAVPLFTGEVEHPLMSEYATDVRIFIQGDAPLPFTILAVAPEMRTNVK